MAFKLTTKPTTNNKPAQVDEDEYTGVWLNLGIVTEDEKGNKKFNRLPRGVAVSDLEPHPIYAKSAERSPEWTAEATLVNALIAKIQEAGLKLKEGESVPIELSVQLYRRQEQLASVAAPEINFNLDDLFG